MSQLLQPLSRALTLAATRDVEDILTFDDDGAYCIAGADYLLARIDSVIEDLETADLTEDDREAVRETRKFANDFIKLVDRAVIDERARVFDGVNAQRKRINDRMEAMKSVLAEKLEQFDQRIKGEKRAELMAHFGDEQSFGEYADVLAGVSYESIENRSWYNRSASASKARAELSDRVKAIATLLGTAGEGYDVARIIDVLATHEWSAVDSIAALQAAKTEQEEQKAAVEQHEQELAEAEKRGRDQVLGELAAKGGNGRRPSGSGSVHRLDVMVLGTRGHADGVATVIVEALEGAGYSIQYNEAAGTVMVGNNNHP